MSAKSILGGIVALVVVVGLIAAGLYVFIGIGEQRAESSYTGHVVDVVEDKGLILRPSWVNMKTNPRSSDVQKFCIHPDDEDELLPKFYEAMEDGGRYTVTYSRPLWVGPEQCDTNQAILHSIEPVNETG